ncbi:MAG: zinc-ribbon domain-containing protein [Roseburia sp.]
MKKLAKKLSILLILVLAATMFTACSAGSTVNTVLTLNADGSGQRVMTIAISDSVFNDYFNGTTDDINGVAEELCPDGMTWAYSENDGVKTYTATIEFTSIDDYQQKVENILGYETEIEYSSSDTVWANGVYLQESFSSLDLLEWMKNALVEREYVDSSNAGYIFSNGSNEIVWGGESYSAGSNLYIETVEEVAIDNIQFSTQMNDTDDYSRQVAFYVNTASMEGKEDQIKEFMEEHLPEGAVGEWTSDETDTIYTISGANYTLDGLNDFDQTLFENESSKVTQKIVTDQVYPFSRDVVLEETIDFSAYFSANSYTSRTFSGADTENYSVFSQYGTDYSYIQAGDDGLADWSQDSYDVVSTYTMCFRQVYPVMAVDVTTKLPVVGDKITKTTVYTLSAQLPKDMRDEVEERILVYAGEKEFEAAADTEALTDTEALADTESSTEKEEVLSYADVSVSFKDKGETTQVTIKESGTAEELQNTDNRLYNSDYNVVAFEQGGSILSVKRDFSFDEYVYLNEFMYDKTDDCTLTYTVKLGSGVKYNSIYYNEMSEDDLSTALTSGLGYGNRTSYKKLDGGEITQTSSGDSYTFDISGKRTNVIALIGYILLIVVIVVVVLLILIKKGVFKKIAAPKEKAPAVPAGQPAAPAEQSATPTVQPEAPAAPQATENVTPAVIFCPQCGEKNEGTSRFCKNCGTDMKGNQ